MGGDHGRGLQPTEDSRPIVLREAAPGDARQEEVDATRPQRVLDEVGASLVVEAGARHVDADAPDLSALVGPGGERVEVIAGQLAVEGHGQAEDQLGVRAGREADRERTELVRSVGLDHHRLPAQPVERHQLREARGAVGPAAESLADRGRVDGVVPVRVADQHADHLAAGVRDDEPLEHRRLGGRLPAAEDRRERDSGHVRVDEQRAALVGHAVARDAEPLELQPGRQLELSRLKLGEGLGVMALLVALLGHEAGEVSQVAGGPEHRTSGGSGRPAAGRLRSLRPSRPSARTRAAAA